MNVARKRGWVSCAVIQEPQSETPPRHGTAVIQCPLPSLQNGRGVQVCKSLHVFAWILCNHKEPRFFRSKLLVAWEVHECVL